MGTARESRAASRTAIGKSSSTRGWGWEWALGDELQTPLQTDYLERCVSCAELEKKHRS